VYQTGTEQRTHSLSHIVNTTYLQGHSVVVVSLTRKMIKFSKQFITTIQTTSTYQQNKNYVYWWFWLQLEAVPRNFVAPPPPLLGRSVLTQWTIWMYFQVLKLEPHGRGSESALADAPLPLPAQLLQQYDIFWERGRPLNF